MVNLKRNVKMPGKITQLFLVVNLYYNTCIQNNRTNYCALTRFYCNGNCILHLHLTWHKSQPAKLNYTIIFQLDSCTIRWANAPGFHASLDHEQFNFGNGKPHHMVFINHSWQAFQSNATWSTRKYVGYRIGHFSDPVLILHLQICYTPSRFIGVSRLLLVCRDSFSFHHRLNLRADVGELPGNDLQTHVWQSTS